MERCSNGRKGVAAVLEVYLPQHFQVRNHIQFCRETSIFRMILNNSYIYGARILLKLPLGSEGLNSSEIYSWLNKYIPRSMIHKNQFILVPLVRGLAPTELKSLPWFVTMLKD
jgi:hypothetical protein